MSPVSPETHTSFERSASGAPLALAYDAEAGAVALGDDEPAARGLLDVPRVLEAARDRADPQLRDARLPVARDVGRLRDRLRWPSQQAAGEGAGREDRGEGQ